MFASKPDGRELRLEESPKMCITDRCCPFHNEKTPSFSVDPDKQMYYCFGCHAGGTVIHFIMNMEKCSFPEAVQHLAAVSYTHLDGYHLKLGPE